MFWTIMAPKGGGEPSGALADAIKAAFGTRPISTNSDAGT